MNTLSKAVALILIACSSAYAAGAASEKAGFLVYLFAGFFAVIIVTQLVPAAILFGSMIKGIFTSDTRTSAQKTK